MLETCLEKVQEQVNVYYNYILNNNCSIACIMSGGSEGGTGIQTGIII